MSIIKGIRNNGKLAGAVIAVSLSIWVISEGANSSSLKDLFRGQGGSHVMKVDGKAVEPKDFQMRVKEYETLMSIFNPQNQLDENSKAQISEQVMQNMIMESVVGDQCDQLGIVTGEEEKKELIYGNNADPLVRRFSFNGEMIFNNPETGTFDPGRVKEVEKALDNPPKGAEEVYAKIKENWNILKTYVIRNNRITKYNVLLGSSFFAPLFIAKHNLDEKSAMASIKFVKIPYTAIPDNKVAVTDEDLKAYINNHKSRFEIDQPSRSIDYVSFEIIPSSADTARAVNALNDAKSAFETTKEKDNKAFVNNRSDDPQAFTEAFLNKKSFASQYADTILGMQPDKAFGPYLENGFYKMTKVVERKTMPDSVKIRHILIKTKEQGKESLSDTVAKMRIDSIVNAIKSGASFDSMVVKYSDDGGSKGTGGVYHWALINRQGIVKEIGDFVFEGKTGDKKTLKVESGNYSGYHYVEIMEQKDEQTAVKIATIAKILQPSDSTVNALYAKANDFASRNNTSDAFDAGIKKLGYDKRKADNIKMSNFTIPGIGANREIVRWIFDKKLGDVSPVFQVGDQRYVVAKLTAANEEGISGVTPANRPMLEQKVREEKKAAEIIKQCQGKGTLDAIAATMGAQVGQADSVVMGASFIQNLGYEPKVAGYTFFSGFQPNTVSPAIKGNGAVYFISVLSRGTKPTDPQAMNQVLAQERGMMEMQLRNSMSQALQQELIHAAKVKYYPANF
jgi:peptidyl-prolyl cis-trans isomerase D